MDCLEGLKQLPDNSVQFVFTDPPYNQNVDYGVYKDNISYTDYLKWLSDIIKECQRISNNSVAFYVYKKIFKDVWNLLPNSDCIIIHHRVSMFDSNYLCSYYVLLTTKQPNNRFTKDLWNDIRLCSEGYFCKEERFNHPCRTSDALVNKVIQTYTNKGDIVVDPFMGTGTTAVVCKKLNRNFIGFEINPEYYKISQQRLQSVIPTKKNFGGYYK
jgi:DNA modification methylase